MVQPAGSAGGAARARGARGAFAPGARASTPPPARPGPEAALPVAPVVPHRHLGRLGAPRVRRHGQEQFRVGGPPLPGEDRLSVALGERPLQHRDAVRAEARERVADLPRERGAAQQPGEPPARPAQRPRVLRARLHRGGAHDVRPALHALHQPGDVLRRLGEIGLEHHRNVALGVGGARHRLAEQALQRRRVPLRALVAEQGHGSMREYGSTTSPVPSVEPSSSTSTSYSRGNSAMTLRSFQSRTPTVGASSRAGMQK